MMLTRARNAAALTLGPRFLQATNTPKFRDWDFPGEGTSACGWRYLRSGQDAATSRRAEPAGWPAADPRRTVAPTPGARCGGWIRECKHGRIGRNRITPPPGHFGRSERLG